MKRIKKCPRCGGKGFLLPKQYQGRCKEGKRHMFTKPSGIRVYKCLVCGLPQKSFFVGYKED